MSSEPDNPRIELINPTVACPDATETVIQTLLGSERKSLVHGEQFTGRPTTWIYHDACHVIKVRSEFRFAARDSRRWAKQAMNQEQAVGVYHPEKVWFLIHQDQTVLIANLAPHLRPLHQLDGNCSADQQYAYLQSMLEMYFNVAVTEQKRLDEGLSNFALDAREQLYYVDDDLYAWDDFNSLTQAMGFWFRSWSWLTAERSTQLGIWFKQLLMDHYQDRHTILIVAGLIESLYMANNTQEQRRSAFLTALQPQLQRTEVKNKLHKQRPMAVLADIHANLPALQAVLADIDQQGIEQALVLGDSVGYGPHPKACIELLQQRDFTVIKGNHDYAVAEGQFKHGFSTHARTVAAWTREQLDASELNWLDTLPTHIRENEWLAVHGSPVDKSYFFAYVYRMSYEANLDNLQQRAIPICFHGHTNMTGIYYRTSRGLDNLCTDLLQSLHNYNHCLINPGSVGQPRDEDGTAARYALYDPIDKKVTFRQVEYDFETTIADMQAYGLPDGLIQRLRQGV